MIKKLLTCLILVILFVNQTSGADYQETKIQENNSLLHQLLLKDIESGLLSNNEFVKKNMHNLLNSPFIDILLLLSQHANESKLTEFLISQDAKNITLTESSDANLKDEKSIELKKLLKSFNKIPYSIEQRFNLLFYKKFADILLDFALFNKNSDLINHLLEQGANPNSIDIIGQSLFDRSICSDPEIYMPLIEYGANLDPNNISASTPLIIATFYNNIPLVNYLINSNVDVNRKNSYGETAFKFIGESQKVDNNSNWIDSEELEQKRKTMEKLFLEAGYKPN